MDPNNQNSNPGQLPPIQPSINPNPILNNGQVQDPSPNPTSGVSSANTSPTNSVQDNGTANNSSQASIGGQPDNVINPPENVPSANTLNTDPVAGQPVVSDSAASPASPAASIIDNAMSQSDPSPVVTSENSTTSPTSSPVENPNYVNPNNPLASPQTVSSPMDTSGGSGMPPSVPQNNDPVQPVSPTQPISSTTTVGSEPVVSSAAIPVENNPSPIVLPDDQSGSIGSSPTDNEPKKGSKIKKAGLLLFALLLLGGIGGGVYYGYNNSVKPKEVKVTNLVLTKAKPTSTPDSEASISAQFEARRITDKTGFGYQVEISDKWEARSFEGDSTASPSELSYSFTNECASGSAESIKILHFASSNADVEINQSVNTFINDGFTVTKINTPTVFSINKAVGERESYQDYYSWIPSKKGYFAISARATCTTNFDEVFDGVLMSFKELP